METGNLKPDSVGAARELPAFARSFFQEAWEARCEQLQAAADVILLCVASRTKQSPEDADKAANIVASQRIENIDAQLAQLLADASASADDFIQEAAQSVRLLECC